MIITQFGTPSAYVRLWLLPLLACLSSANAAPQGHVVSGEVIEEIIVVGSHIPQVDETGLAPVLVLDRQAIENTASMYLGDVLQQLPFDNNGTFNDRDPLSSALGGSGISLRGLGANSVLVLINGRRATSYGFSLQPGNGSLVAFVDLNSIPVAAVERVEVLKDGASASYGSGAIAGVVNIVLRDRFSGGELQMRIGEADQSGAEERGFSGIFGWVGEHSNIELIASYSERNPLAWSDRGISESANHEFQGGLDLRDIAASNFLTDVGVSAFGADCENRNESSDDGSFEEVERGICLYNPNQAIVQPSVKRAGATVMANYAFSAALNLHLEGSYLDSKLKGKLEPTELNGATFPAQNPWSPFGEDALTYYQFTETGPRINDVTTDNYRAVLVLEGQRGEWNGEIGGLYHRADSENHSEGQLHAATIHAALQGVDLNGDGVIQDNEYLNLFSPVSHPNSPELIDSLLISTYRKSTTELASAFAQIVGPLLTLPAGELIVAFGVDHSYESLDDRSDPLSVGAQLAALEPPDRYFGLRVDQPFDQIDPLEHIDVWDVPGFQTVAPSGAPLSKGDRNRSAIYAEFQIPVLDKLQLQAALRYDQIDDLDSELSPHIALRYQPVDKHALRASWGKGFRAPSLAELHIGPSSQVQASWDPEVCPEPGFLIPELAGGCVVKSFLTVSHGNQELQSETSESWSIGITSNFTDRLSTALDCWRVTVDDRIIALGPERILRHEQTLGPGFLVRLAPDPFQEAAGISGYTDQINDPYINAASQKVKGCDLEMNAGVQTERYGEFGAQMIGTHMASNKLQILPEIPSEQLAGTFGYPEKRVNLNLFWHRQDWRANLQGRYTDSFDRAFGSGSVDSHTEWDARLSFSGISGFDFTLGIENLFDKTPPSAFGLQGFPHQYYDMRGRFFYAQVSVNLSELGSSPTD